MCSTRIRRPWTALAYSQTSPAHAAALAELEPRRAREHDVGRDADAADDEIGGELAAALRDHARDAFVALEPVDLVGVDHADPALGEDTAEERADLVAEAALHRLVLEHHDRHLLADRAQRGGHLAADVRPADAHDVLGLVELGADRVGVAERAQVVDAVELRAVDLQPADHRAGRDERVLVADGLLRRQRRLPRRGVELHHARARQELDGRVVEPPGLGTEARLAALLAAQVLLRERRPVVRRIELAARQQDAAVEPAAHELARGRGGGDSPTDQEDVDGAISHVCTLSRRMLALA